MYSAIMRFTVRYSAKRGLNMRFSARMRLGVEYGVLVSVYGVWCYMENEPFHGTMS